MGLNLSEGIGPHRAVVAAMASARGPGSGVAGTTPVPWQGVA